MNKDFAFGFIVLVFLAVLTLYFRNTESRFLSTVVFGTGTRAVMAEGRIQIPNTGTKK
jgi:hypothetical protein